MRTGQRMAEEKTGQKTQQEPQQKTPGWVYQCDGSIAECREFISEVVARHLRVAVTGRPGIGKTLATKHLPNVLRTDDFKRMSWDRQCSATLEWGTRPKWVMEGVTVARALRHGLNADAVVVLLGMPRVPMGPLMSPRAMSLGDQVVKWATEAVTEHPAQFYMWTVHETKRC